MGKKNNITKSWEINALEWARLIEQESIASRKFTNPAIVKAVKKYKPVNILDLGCGEGWLARALSTDKNKVTGIDATEVLLEIARKNGTQNFYRMTYEEIIDDAEIPEAPFDAVVLNFCLYQKEEIPHLLLALKNSLVPSGFIFIQTLHPAFLILNELPYENQWINNSWKGLKGNFVKPHSWYARTFENWIRIFGECKLNLTEAREIINSDGKPASVLFILKNE